MKLAACTRPALFVIALLAIGAALPAAAQTVIGGKDQPNVIVDYSVLEELGPRPNVPQVLLRGIGAHPPAGAPQPHFPIPPGKDAESASGRITLTPPAGTTPRRSAAKPVSQKPRAKMPAKAAPKTKPEPPTTSARAPKPSTPPPAPPPPPAAQAVQPEPEGTAAPPMAAKPQEPAPVPPPSAPERRSEPPPAASAPPPAPESKPSKAPAEIAKSSPEPSGPTPIAPGQSLRVGFDTGSAKLSPDASQQLKRVAKGMAEDDELRIQLLAYADGTSDTASQARRLSLSRALAARSFLIGEGVRSTRIDVRALGNKSEGGPPDRIDVIVTKR